MGISLEQAVEIICHEMNSTVISKEDFDKHIEPFGICLMVEYFHRKEDGTDIIVYRNTIDSDVVAFSMGSTETEYRKVHIKSLTPNKPVEEEV